MNDTASILIVDDEEVVRRSHLRSLTVTGCHAEAASDGQEALQKAHSSYSFPSMVYLSLPMHSATAFSPA